MPSKNMPWGLDDWPEVKNFFSKSNLRKTKFMTKWAFILAIISIFFTTLNLISLNKKDEIINRDDGSILFQKNVECQKLRSTAEKIAKSYDVYNSGGMIMELFYSPLANTCLFSFTHTTVNTPIKDESLIRQYFKLYDLFSNKLLIDLEAKFKNGEWDNTSELFKSKVEKYK